MPSAVEKVAPSGRTVAEEGNHLIGVHHIGRRYRQRQIASQNDFLIFQSWNEFRGGAVDAGRKLVGVGKDGDCPFRGSPGGVGLQYRVVALSAVIFVIPDGSVTVHVDFTVDVDQGSGAVVAAVEQRVGVASVYLRAHWRIPDLAQSR